MLQAALLFFCPAGARVEGAWMAADEDGGLVGPVRSVRVWRAQFVRRGGEYVEGRRVPSYAAEYDARGRKTGEARTSPDGSLVTRNAFTYDSGGRLVVMTQDNAGPSPNANRTAYAYDARGRLREETRRSADGTPLGRAVYTYDSGGNRVGQAEYEAGGALLAALIFKYGGRGRLAEAAFCSGAPGGGVIAWGDEGGGAPPPPGRAAGRAGGPPCGDGLLLKRVEFTRDADGEVTGEGEYAGDGTILARRVVTRDPGGKWREVAEYGADGLERGGVSFSYEFDSRGNWVRRVERRREGGTREAEPVEVTYREIAYFGAQ